MPEISRFYGIRIYMLHDDHNPPHIHAEYSGNTISINIKTGLVKGKMPKRALKLIFKWMELHEKELFELWELAVEGKELPGIAPLN